MHVYISSIGAIVQLGARLHECTYLQFTYTLVETSFLSISYCMVSLTQQQPWSGGAHFPP